MSLLYWLDIGSTACRKLASLDLVDKKLFENMENIKKNKHSFDIEKRWYSKE